MPQQKQLVGNDDVSYGLSVEARVVSKVTDSDFQLLQLTINVFQLLLQVLQWIVVACPRTIIDIMQAFQTVSLSSIRLQLDVMKRMHRIAYFCNASKPAFTAGLKGAPD